MAGLALVLLPLSLWGKEPEWVGRWQFEEVWPDTSGSMHNGMSYSLTLKSDKEGYRVDIDIDGFQTMERIQANGLMKDKVLEIQFQRLRPGHAGVEYKQGDLLLRLVDLNGKITTEWGAIKPVLDGNKKPGVYFKKANTKTKQQ